MKTTQIINSSLLPPQLQELLRKVFLAISIDNSVELEKWLKTDVLEETKTLLSKLKENKKKYSTIIHKIETYISGCSNTPSNTEILTKIFIENISTSTLLEAAITDSTPKVFSYLIQLNVLDLLKRTKKDTNTPIVLFLVATHYSNALVQALKSHLEHQNTITPNLPPIYFLLTLINAVHTAWNKKAKDLGAKHRSLEAFILKKEKEYGKLNSSLSFDKDSLLEPSLNNFHVIEMTAYKKLLEKLESLITIGPSEIKSAIKMGDIYRLTIWIKDEISAEKEHVQKKLNWLKKTTPQNIQNAIKRICYTKLLNQTEKDNETLKKECAEQTSILPDGSNHFEIVWQSVGNKLLSNDANNIKLELDMLEAQTKLEKDNNDTIEKYDVEKIRISDHRLQQRKKIARSGISLNTLSPSEKELISHFPVTIITDFLTCAVENKQNEILNFLLERILNPLIDRDNKDVLDFLVEAKIANKITENEYVKLLNVILYQLKLAEIPKEIPKISTASRKVHQIQSDINKYGDKLLKNVNAHFFIRFLKFGFYEKKTLIECVLYYRELQRAVRGRDDHLIIDPFYLKEELRKVQKNLNVRWPLWQGKGDLYRLINKCIKELDKVLISSEGKIDLDLKNSVKDITVRVQINDNEYELDYQNKESLKDKQIIIMRERLNYLNSEIQEVKVNLSKVEENVQKLKEKQNQESQGNEALKIRVEKQSKENQVLKIQLEQQSQQIQTQEKKIKDLEDMFLRFMQRGTDKKVSSDQKVGGLHTHGTFKTPNKNGKDEVLEDKIRVGNNSSQNSSQGLNPN